MFIVVVERLIIVCFVREKTGMVIFVLFSGPNDTAFPLSDQHPPKKPALSKAHTVPLFFVLPVKFLVCPAKESPR